MDWKDYKIIVWTKMLTPFVTLPRPYKNQPCLILMPCGSCIFLIVNTLQAWFFASTYSQWQHILHYHYHNWEVISAMSQESQRDRQEGVCMKHMNEDDPLCAKKEAKIIRMVMLVAAIVSNERRYSISQMAEWRNSSVGVTNAGKAQQSMVIISRIWLCLLGKGLKKLGWLFRRKINFFNM